MTTDTAGVRYDTANPVDDQYSPPARGELDEVAAVLADGRLSGGAVILPVYEQALAPWWGVRRVMATNSGTSALHATLATLSVRAGDKVLAPATAPIATAMPILTCGATPVIVDTAPNSLALDPFHITANLTDHTRAALTPPM